MEEETYRRTNQPTSEAEDDQNHHGSGKDGITALKGVEGWAITRAAEKRLDVLRRKRENKTGANESQQQGDPS